MERIVGLFIISLFISMFLYNTHFIASKHSATPSDILQKKYNKTAHHHNPPPNNFGINSEKIRTFLESIPKKAEHFWIQFRKKPNIFGKSSLNRSVVASNRCTRKFRFGRNIRIPRQMMPTNRSNDNHSPNHNNATIRPTCPTCPTSPK